MGAHDGRGDEGGCEAGPFVEDPKGLNCTRPEPSAPGTLDVAALSAGEFTGGGMVGEGEPDPGAYDGTMVGGADGSGWPR